MVVEKICKNEEATINKSILDGKTTRLNDLLQNLFLHYFHIFKIFPHLRCWKSLEVRQEPSVLVREHCMHSFFWWEHWGQKCLWMFQIQLLENLYLLFDTCIFFLPKKAENQGQESMHMKGKRLICSQLYFFSEPGFLHLNSK